MALSSPWSPSAHLIQLFSLSQKRFLTGRLLTQVCWSSPGQSPMKCQTSSTESAMREVWGVRSGKLLKQQLFMELRISLSGHFVEFSFPSAECSGWHWYLSHKNTCIGNSCFNTDNWHTGCLVTEKSPVLQEQIWDCVQMSKLTDLWAVVCATPLGSAGLFESLPGDNTPHQNDTGL